MKIGRPLLLLFAFMFILAGCGPKLITKYEAFPKLYEERPLAILVLSPINETTAADAKEFYSTTVAEPLSLSGYYIYPIEVISEILQNEGIYDTETLINLNPQKFKEYFGADAVMYIWIKKWDTSYLILAANVAVSLRCLLRSTKTGENLWEYEGTIIEDTTVRSSGGGLAGLIVTAVATAIKTAATDYVPIAKRVNYMVLSTMPYGKYHSNYEKDRDFKTVQEKLVKPTK